MSRLCTPCVGVALLCPLPAGCGGDSGDTAVPEGPAWNHDPGDPVAGPAAWGEIDQSFEQCLAGDSQSPVDIAETLQTDLPELEFGYPPTPFVVKNTGHTIEASMPEASDLTLTIGNDEYRLVQFHFHAPSEHTLGGESYPAELHLVHESEAGELAVVGIFVEPSALPAPLIDEVIETAGEVGEEVEIADALSPLELLLDLDPPRAVVDRYYTYPGSLTTPGCTEGVRWIVLQDIHIIDEGTVQLLHRIIADFPGYELPEQQPADAAVERPRDRAQPRLAVRLCARPESASTDSGRAKSLRPLRGRHAQNARLTHRSELLRTRSSASRVRRSRPRGDRRARSGPRSRARRRS